MELQYGEKSRQPQNVSSLPPDSDLGNASDSGSIEDLRPVSDVYEPDGIERVIGLAGAELRSCIWLPDNRLEWPQLVAANGVIHGAFVALVLHDSLLAERSIDAAERAASLIGSENGTVLCVAPYASRVLDKSPLTARQWNHATAMIERLYDLAKRFRLDLYVRETVGEPSTMVESSTELECPISYALDTGRFLFDGFVPTLLVRPNLHSGEVELTPGPIPLDG